MAAVLGSAVYELKADQTGLMRGIDKAGKDSKKKLQAIGKNMSVAVTGPILGIGAAVFAASEEIDRAMRTISAGTGATGLDLQYLRRDFEAVFGSVPGSADQVATAIQALNTLLGLTGEELQEAARAALLLHDATGADLETVISKTAAAMNLFNIDGDQFAVVVDKMFRASKITGVEIDLLLTTIGRYGAALSAAGFSMDEVIALLGNMSKSGVPARTVMSGLSTAISKLAQEGVTDLRQGFDDLVDRIQNDNFRG